MLAKPVAVALSCYMYKLNIIIAAQLYVHMIWSVSFWTTWSVPSIAAVLGEADVDIYSDKVIGLGKESRVCEGKLKGFNIVAVKKFKLNVDDEEIKRSIRETR